MEWRSIIVGAAGSLGLVALYVGIMSFDGGLSAALREFGREWWLISGIVLLFGLQLALYRTVRHSAKLLTDGSLAAGAVTAGTTAGSMLACCLHHVVDVLPVLGVTALGTVLGQYRGWLFGLAYLSSFIGIALMLRALRHLRSAVAAAPAKACH